VFHYLTLSHPDVFLNIYKVQNFSVKHIQFFIVKDTFKATCFGSTEPKHVASNVSLTIKNLMCLTDKFCTLYMLRYCRRGM